MLSVQTTTTTTTTKRKPTCPTQTTATATATAAATNGNLNQQQQQLQLQPPQQPTKRKRTKLTGNQQRRQSGQVQTTAKYHAYQRRLSSENIPISGGPPKSNQSSDESVWIFGLINNIEQLLTTFNAINTNSSPSVAAAAALAARNGSGSSTPSSSSSSSTFSSTLSSPQSSPASANTTSSSSTTTSNSSSATIPVQQLAQASGGAAQTLPRSPMSRQIKFHEYKGPPSSKRQQQQQQQQNQNQLQAQNKQQTSISTNNITANAAQQQQHAQQAKDKVTDIAVVSSAPKESVKMCLAQKSNRISSPKTSQQQQQQQNAAPGQQQQQSSASVGSIGLQVNQATPLAGAKDLMTEFGVSLQQSHSQRQQHHQSLVNFHFSEPANGSYNSVQNDPCQTNLMPVQTQAHILHHPPQQQQQQQQQQQLVRQVRLTSGPQCATIQQASFATSISQQQALASDSIAVGGDQTTHVLVSSPIGHNQQQQPQRQTAPVGKIDPNESYHQHHNHQSHYLPQQLHVQQLHSQAFSNNPTAAPSTFMIHTTGHGSSNGSFVGRQLYSPIQIPQQQHTLRTDSSDSLATSRSTAMAELHLKETASNKPAHRKQVQQQSIMPPQLQQQQQQQQNTNYRYGVAQELLGCGQHANLSYNIAPLNQLDSNLINDGNCLNDDDSVDSLAVFGPDSEDIDACDIEPSIGFSHGSDELLFSEFIDLQDVPMNVDESDWLKKFLPPCSMG